MKNNYFYGLVLIALLMLGVNQAKAQSVKKIVKSTVGLFSARDIHGTWYYEGTDIQFQSKNLLKKAGGKVAASRMEKELNEKLDNMGFVPGVTIFTFEEDGTFSNVTNGTVVKGKYTYDDSSKYITLKYLNHIPIKAKVSGTGDKMSFLFEANGFLSMITFIGSHSGISIIKSVTSLLNSYDGMMVGMELKRK